MLYFERFSSSLVLLTSLLIKMIGNKLQKYGMSNSNNVVNENSGALYQSVVSCKLTQCLCKISKSDIKYIICTFSLSCPLHTPSFFQFCCYFDCSPIPSCFLYFNHLPPGIPLLISVTY